jgi:hypothetical protein
MRKSTVLCLPLQLVFLALGVKLFHPSLIFAWRGRNHPHYQSSMLSAGNMANSKILQKSFVAQASMGQPFCIEHKKL